MDLPIITKFENFHPSVFGVKMFFLSTFGEGKECGRVKSRYPKAIKRIDPTEVQKSTEVQKHEDIVNHTDMSPEDIIERLKECSVTGCGGAGFPTYNKLALLESVKDRKRHLIINAVECDIGLINDEYVVDEFFAEIESAANILKEAFSFDDITMGVTRNIRHQSDVFSIKRVVDAYPVGAERILINELTGDVVPQSRRPLEYGYVVLNVQTLLTVYNALIKNQTFNGKFITIADMISGNAYPAYVEFGSDVYETIHRYIEVPSDKESTIYVGSGALKAHPAIPGEKTDRTVSFIAYGKPYTEKETVECMYCGACLRACPMDLKVNRLAEHIIEGRFDLAELYHPERCIGCNSCTYTCFINRTNSKIILEYNQRKNRAQAE